MRKDLTSIVLVVDRSGSMSSCRDDAQGGINTFIEEQKKAVGEAKITLIQFDDLYEVVHENLNIQDVPPYVLMPRGMTALLDAVGKAISITGERLHKLDEKDRPGCVIVVIVTDGHENASKEFTKSQIKNMIELQQNMYKWQFTFFGADASSFDEAKSLGINLSSIVQYNQEKIKNIGKVVSLNVSRMRGASISGQEIKSCYLEEELDSLA